MSAAAHSRARRTVSSGGAGVMRSARLSVSALAASCGLTIHFFCEVDGVRGIPVLVYCGAYGGHFMKSG